MDWLVIQLTSWAEKKLDTKSLAQELRRKTKTVDLELYYSDLEDVVGKHQTAFSEYLFVEYRSDISYHELEGGDIFYCILRDKSGKPQLITDVELQKIKNQTEEEQRFSLGDHVKVCKGPLKGTMGAVIAESDNHIIISVSMSEVVREASIPKKWCRRRRRR